MKLAEKMKMLYADTSKNWVEDLSPIVFPNPFYLERVVPKMTMKVPLTVNLINLDRGVFSMSS